jgi:hypothetical protein
LRVEKKNRTMQALKIKRKKRKKKKMNEQKDEIGEKNAEKWEMKGQGCLAFPLPQCCLYPLGGRLTKCLFGQSGGESVTNIIKKKIINIIIVIINKII